MKLRQTPARCSTKPSRKENTSTKSFQEEKETDCSDSEDGVSFEEIAPFSDNEDCDTERLSSKGSKMKRPSRSNGTKASPKVAKTRKNTSQSIDKTVNQLDIELIIDSAQIDKVKEVLHQLPDHFAEEYCKYLFALQNRVPADPNINKQRPIQYSKPNIVLNDTCIICGRKFTNLRELKKHVIAEHETPEGYHCPPCDKLFETLTKFNHHVTFIHLMVYPCSYCKESFQGISCLNEHLSSAHPGKDRFTCTICNKGFPRSFNLMMHINLHTGLTPHKCEHCPKAYAGGDSLREHARHHNKDKYQFKCDECSKIFCSQKLLNVHALIHGTERKFKCDLCEKAYKTYHNMVKHKKSHTKHGSKINAKKGAITECDSNPTPHREVESISLQDNFTDSDPLEIVSTEMEVNKEPLQLQKTIFGDFEMDSESDSDSDED